MAAWRQWLADWAAHSKSTQKLGPVGPVIQRQAQRNALRMRLQQNPALRFETLAEVQLAAELGVAIDVNRASIEDWLRLPGLSIHQARLLAQLAQAGVQFHAIEDLAVALGVALGQVEGWAGLLRFRFYDQEALLTVEGGAIALNPNQASPEQLLRLPRIDASLIQAILTQRQQQPFQNLIDFKTRLQLSADTVECLMHYLQF